jgi:hypothetical protein
MEPKEPVLLVVLVEVPKLRWFAASIGSREATPLVRSPEGDLAEYLDLDFDEQVTFLRHRLCGVLQRGVDRLWPRKQKAAQIAIVLDRSLESRDPAVDLTLRVAEHFAEWMTSPPVVVAIDESALAPGTHPQLRLLAGDIPAAWRQQLDAQLPRLASLTADTSLWETTPRKRAKTMETER